MSGGKLSNADCGCGPEETIKSASGVLKNVQWRQRILSYFVRFLSDLVGLPGAMMIVDLLPRGLCLNRALVTSGDVL